MQVILMESPNATRFTCRRCFGYYPKQFFSKDKSRRSGRSKYCKACNSVKCKSWYESNAQYHISNVRRRKLPVCLRPILEVSET